MPDKAIRIRSLHHALKVLTVRRAARAGVVKIVPGAGVVVSIPVRPAARCKIGIVRHLPITSRVANMRMRQRLAVAIAVFYFVENRHF